MPQGCRVSRNIKQCLASMLKEAQSNFEESLRRQTLADLVCAIKKGR
jgi:DNA-binding IscR family transcriptional regulator